MTTRRLILAVAAACLVIAPSAPAGTATPTVIRADCARDTERPARIVLACGDGNAVLTDLAWTRWRAGTATATGTLNTNTCDPTCAGGTFVSFPATVRADRRVRCSGSAFGYTRLRVAYPGDRPPGAVQAFTVPYRCPATLTVGRVTDNGVVFVLSAVRRGDASVIRVVARRDGARITGTTLASGRWFAATTTGAVETGRITRRGARAGVFVEITDAARGERIRYEIRLSGTRLSVTAAAVA